MTIMLKPDQKKWLQDQVAAGTFASEEDAVRLAVADLMANLEDGDLEWAKPLVDVARASIARGEGVAAAAVKADLAKQLRKLGAP